MKKSNVGFSLVELMVSLVIGLILILGAGQMYLSTKLAFDESEVLSNDSAILNFSANVMMQDFKKASFFASNDPINPDDGTYQPVSQLSLTFASGVVDEYFCSGKVMVEKSYYLGASAVNPDGNEQGIYAKARCQGDADFGDPVLVFDSIPSGGMTFRRTSEHDLYAWEVNIKFHSMKSGEIKDMTLLTAVRTNIVTHLQDG